MIYLVIFYVILGAYFMEYPKMFEFYVSKSVRRGQFIGHFVMLIMSIVVACQYYRFSNRFLFYPEFFFLLVLLDLMCVFISLGAVFVLIRGYHNPKKQF